MNKIKIEDEILKEIRIIKLKKIEIQKMMKKE
jgi:hypothetical protein